VDPSIPAVVHTPRKVQVSLKDKDEIDRMEQTGVIIKQTEPTDWVNRSCRLWNATSKAVFSFVRHIRLLAIEIG